MASLFKTLEQIEDNLVRTLRRGHRAGTDPYFPWRMVLILLLGGLQVIRLLGFPEEVTEFLDPTGQNPYVSVGFIYFRGWFLLLWLGIVFHAYRRQHWPATLFTLATCIGGFTLLFDVFTVFLSHWVQPNPLVVLTNVVRLLTLSQLLVCALRADRIPPKHQRWNLLLPWVLKR